MIVSTVPGTLTGMGPNIPSNASYTRVVFGDPGETQPNPFHSSAPARHYSLAEGRRLTGCPAPSRRWYCLPSKAGTGVMSTVQNGFTESPATIRRWFCLPSKYAHLTGQNQEPSRLGSVSWYDQPSTRPDSEPCRERTGLVSPATGRVPRKPPLDQRGLSVC